MAMRNPTMSLYNSDETPERWHLVRRVFLLFLLVVALSLGLVILFRQKSDYSAPIVQYFGRCQPGAADRTGTRFVLRQVNWFIQGVASAAMVLIGLAVLGYFTIGKAASAHCR